MKATKILFVIVLICLIAVFGYFVYSAFVNGSKVPKEVKEDAGYPLTIAYAEELRFLEFGVAAIVFPLVVFALAVGRMPVTSWLRSLLGAAIALLLVFVLFAQLMENRFRERFAGASLPLESVTTAFVYCLWGFGLAFLVFFTSERIHVWRLGRPVK